MAVNIDQATLAAINQEQLQFKVVVVCRPTKN
jgi:hypothetical protein